MPPHVGLPNDARALSSAARAANEACGGFDSASSTRRYVTERCINELKAWRALAPRNGKRTANHQPPSNADHCCRSHLLALMIRQTRPNIGAIMGATPVAHSAGGPSRPALRSIVHAWLKNTVPQTETQRHPLHSASAPRIHEDQS
jgi:hypothetical protein